MKQLTCWLAGAVLAAGVQVSAVASSLVGSAPVAGQAWGQQSDGNSPPAYEQSFAAPSGAVLEAIRWWGFHTPASGGAAFDNFVVKLGGVTQVGTLSIVHVSPDYDEYTLDVADAPLVASMLSVMNDSFDVEWFWQSAQAVGNPSAPDATAVAYSLIGQVGAGQPLPEPPIAALVVMALAVQRWCSRARGASRAHAA